MTKKEIKELEQTILRDEELGEILAEVEELGEIGEVEGNGNT